MSLSILTSIIAAAESASNPPSSAHLEAWAADALEPTQGGACAGVDLYASYVKWMTANRPRGGVYTLRSFCVKLGEVGIPKGRNQSVRVWLGMRIKPGFEGAAVAATGRAVDDRHAALVREWIGARCVLGDALSCTASDLFADFFDYAGDGREHLNGLRPRSQWRTRGKVSFALALRAEVPGLTWARWLQNGTAGPKQHTIYQGITLRVQRPAEAIETRAEFIRERSIPAASVEIDDGDI